MCISAHAVLHGVSPLNNGVISANEGIPESERRYMGYMTVIRG